MEYEEVYFARTGREGQLTDKTIAGASALVVYLADGADVQVEIDRIFAGNQNLTDCELQYEEKYCDVYYLYGE